MDCSARRKESQPSSRVELTRRADSRRKPLSCRSVALTHLRIPDNVVQADNVGSARKVLKDLDLALDLLFLDRLEDLDDALVIVDRVDALEHLRVL